MLLSNITNSIPLRPTSQQGAIAVQSTSTKNANDNVLMLVAAQCTKIRKYICQDHVINHLGTEKQIDITVMQYCTTSSVARGGGGGAIAPPHWPANQNAE